MNNMKKFVGTAAAFVVLGLAPAGLAVPKAAAADRLHIAMMDDDMKMKSDSSNTNMGQPGAPSQNMGGGRMDDKMKMQMPQGGSMQQPGQMRDCQGSGCPQSPNMMMQMMRMMHGQMNSPSGAASDASTSGPADVTERLEGRIAFLKTELQITDKQTPDWNALADALRSSRQHLLDARKLLVTDDKASGTERIEHYEHHLSERLEAIKSARSAFNRLYGSLSDGQKQTADAILLPLFATF